MAGGKSHWLAIKIAALLFAVLVFFIVFFWRCISMPLSQTGGKFPPPQPNEVFAHTGGYIRAMPQ